MVISSFGSSSSGKNDDEYKEAAQQVIDDNMRTDVLGAALCKVLNEHIPTSQILKTIIKDTIDDLDARRRGRLFDAGMGIIGGIAIAGITKLFFG